MVNRMILQGRLCSDPELRRTNSGTAVCSFRVAWSEKVKDRETKLFLPCVAWQSTAEMICKHFSKGKEIIVEGKLSSREYEDNSGNKRTVVAADGGPGTFLRQQGQRTTEARTDIRGDFRGRRRFSVLIGGDEG